MHDPTGDKNDWNGVFFIKPPYAAGNPRKIHYNQKFY